MSTALTVYQKMPDALSAVKELGKAIALSQIFGVSNEFQGQIMALECMQRNIAPLTLAERYHVVQGKLMMKYDAMLAEFQAQGGKHKIIARTDSEAAIELTIDGQTITERLTWDEASKEKYPYAKDGKTIKDNWATPRSRRQMLWARVVSEGVRSLRPGVNNGCYTPEEFDGSSNVAEDTVDAEFVVKSQAATKSPTPGSNGNGHASKAEAKQVEVSKVAEAAKPELITHAQQTAFVSFVTLLKIDDAALAKILGKRNVKHIGELSQVQAAEILAALRAKSEALAAAEAANGKPAEPAKPEQAKAEASEIATDVLISLTRQLGMKSEQIGKMLAKRNANTWAELSTEHRTELYKTLTGLLAKQVAGTSTANGNTQQTESNGPATELQVAKAQTLLKEFEQVKPGTLAKVAEKLNAVGKAKIAELTENECAILLRQLELKQMEAFFELSLKPKATEAATAEAQEAPAKN
jgi:hypothetical protein